MRRVVDELVLLIASGSKHLIETRHCGIELILRIEIEQFGLRQIDLSETLVERGLELARSECIHLVDDRLPSLDGAFRNLQRGLRLQSIVEGKVRRKDDVLPRRLRLLLGGFCLKR